MLSFPSLSYRPSSPIRVSSLVLAHEKLFLDHLPSADRYYKSFMHRDVVNTISVTKSVQRAELVLSTELVDLAVSLDQVLER